MEERIKTPTIKLSDVERMTKSVRTNTGNNDPELSLEFILTAFFPTCWHNMQEALNKQYTLGYIQGREDTLKEIRSHNYGEDDADCFSD